MRIVLFRQQFQNGGSVIKLEKRANHLLDGRTIDKIFAMTMDLQFKKLTTR
jgi:hypothetical protein